MWIGFNYSIYFFIYRYKQLNPYMYNQYNPYTAGNHIHYQEGDLIIAESKEKNASIKILKGIIIEGERYIDSKNIVTVKRIDDEQTYTIPTTLIIVCVPSIYYRFNEFKNEILSMSSEDGKEYERLYNIYKTTDNAKYYIGDFIYADGPCLVTKLDVDSKGKLYYEATNIEGDTIRVYESDIKASSTYEDYQRERRKYEISLNKKLEEQHDVANVTIPNTVAPLCDSVGEIIDDSISHNAVDNVSYNTVDNVSHNTVDNVSHNTVDNVSHNVVDSLENKHKKTEKLLKLGIALFLGGI